MKKYISLFLSILILLSITGCGKADPVKDSGKLSIVTTIFPYYDFAREIAGEKAEITMLLSPGAESHDYEPSPQDIIKISNADLFIYNGGESDEWVETILDSLDSDVKILCMFDYITPICTEEEHSDFEHDHDHEHSDDAHKHNHSEYDEHIWTSPANAIKFTEVISGEIIKCDEENSDFYQENADLYIDELYNLDTKFAGILTGGEKLTVVVADRFPLLYFADRYDMDYKSAFPGCSAETQPSIATVTDLIDYVNEEQIPVVFHMDTTNQKFAQLVAEDTDTRVDTLYSCHNVTKEQFENGATYLSLMELNLTALTEAF